VTIAPDVKSQDVTTEELLERARALRPIFSEKIEETERLTHIPEDLHEQLQEAGFYQLLTPKRYGGHEVDLPTYVKIWTEIARGDMSGAWNSCLAANHALRQSFVYLDLAVMQQPEAYIREADKLVDAHGKVAGPDADAMLSRFMQAFAAWVARVGTAAAVPFDQFLRQREEASLAYINGDPEPVIALSTRTDPASFFPPSGDRVIGAKSVDAANRKGGQAFAKGSTGRFEILASGAGRDFAYWTGVQHAAARMQGKDAPVPMQLRTTEIFRNEGGEWKLVHRHADFIKDDAKQA